MLAKALMSFFFFLNLPNGCSPSPQGNYSRLDKTKIEQEFLIECLLCLSSRERCVMFGEAVFRAKTPFPIIVIRFSSLCFKKKRALTSAVPAVDRGPFE